MSRLTCQGPRSRFIKEPNSTYLDLLSFPSDIIYDAHVSAAAAIVIISTSREPRARARTYLFLFIINLLVTRAELGMRNVRRYRPSRLLFTVPREFFHLTNLSLRMTQGNRFSVLSVHPVGPRNSMTPDDHTACSSLTGFSVFCLCLSHQYYILHDQAYPDSPLTASTTR